MQPHQRSGGNSSRAGNDQCLAEVNTSGFTAISRHWLTEAVPALVLLGLPIMQIKDSISERYDTEPSFMVSVR